MFYHEMLKEKKILQQKLASIQSTLSTMPENNFFYTHNGKYQKWYHTNGKNHTYIPKSEYHLAEKLAYKKYLSYLFEDLATEQEAINLYLQHKHAHPSKTSTLLQDPVYKTLLSNKVSSVSNELATWANTPYETNPKHPEQLTVETFTGNFVRSKSEALIDMILTLNEIPFRYECALHLNNIIIYPDFTIHHPKKEKIYYWEHFGLMDDPVYSRKACSKLQTYTSNGIIPSIQLITTYETQLHPLSTKAIEKIVEEYFL